ncbi:MAG: hypothetical protein QM679_00250 [Patulibacter sp.]
MSVPSVVAMVPEDSGGPYVIAAYVVFLTIVVIYVAIMAQRLTRLTRQADAIQARLDARDAAARDTGASAAPGAAPNAAAVPAATAEGAPR